MRIRRIILIVVAVLAVAGIVFGVLWLTREKLDYAGAAGNVREMLGAKEIILSEWEDDELVENYSDLDTTGIDELDKAIAKFEEYYGSLGASNVLKDDVVKTDYDALADLANNLKEMGEVLDLMKLYLVALESGEDVTSILDEMSKSGNAWLSNFGTDLIEYKNSLNDFSEKYGAGVASDETAMLEEYGVLMLEGEELEEKYAAVGWEEILGVSEDEMVADFDQVSQLLELLERK